MRFKLVRERVVYENPWVRLYDDEVILPDGSPGTYAWVEPSGRRGGVIVIPRRPDGKILLIRVNRYAVRADSWEFPRGYGADGEDAESAAKRELLEETSLQAESVSSLGTFSPDAGFFGVRHTVTVVDVRHEPGETLALQSSEAILEGRFVSRDEAWQMVAGGHIYDGTTLSALAMLVASG